MSRAPDEPRLLDTDNAAAFLGMSPAELKGLVAGGLMPWVNVSVSRRPMVRFDRRDLIAFKEGRAFDPIGDDVPEPAPEPAPIGESEVVYFVRSGPFVKIGFSRNMRSRMRNLQIAHPTPIYLVATIPGGAEREKALHQQFAALRVNGEWFREVDDLAIFIANLGAE